MIEMYPVGTMHMLVNLQNPDHKTAFDLMLSRNSQATLPINKVEVKVSDIVITDIKFQFPYVLVLFHLEKNSVVKAIKEEKVAAPVIGPTDKVTDDTLPPEDREKKIRESMGPSVRKDK